MTMRLCFVFLFALSFNTNAETVHFDLLADEIEDVDEQVSFQLEQSGLTLSLTANSGVLNRTSSGFGVNAEGSGDDTNGLDDGSGVIESITIRFDQDVSLVSLLLTQLGSNDVAAVQFDSTDYLISSATNPFTESIVMAANEELILSFVQGNGFSFNEITVSTSNVPVPAAVWLFASGVISLLIRSR